MIRIQNTLHILKITILEIFTVIGVMMMDEVSVNSSPFDTSTLDNCYTLELRKPVELLEREKLSSGLEIQRKAAENCAVY